MMESIYQFISENQGVTAYRVAQFFKTSRTKIEDEMCNMTTLCEDDNGHLYTLEYAYSVF